jgi:polyisoprenoid-binding protein YceI
LRAAFLASTEINRDEFDVSWNQALEGGGFLVGKGVRIELDVEAVREAEQEAQRE